jgi:hypothetical protein
MMSFHPCPEDLIRSHRSRRRAIITVAASLLCMSGFTCILTLATSLSPQGSSGLGKATFAPYGTKVCCELVNSQHGLHYLFLTSQDILTKVTFTVTCTTISLTNIP